MRIYCRYSAKAGAILFTGVIVFLLTFCIFYLQYSNRFASARIEKHDYLADNKEVTAHNNIRHAVVEATNLSDSDIVSMMIIAKPDPESMAIYSKICTERKSPILIEALIREIEYTTQLTISEGGLYLHTKEGIAEHMPCLNGLICLSSHAFPQLISEYIKLGIVYEDDYNAKRVRLRIIEAIVFSDYVEYAISVIDRDIIINEEPKSTILKHMKAKILERISMQKSKAK